MLKELRFKIFLRKIYAWQSKQLTVNLLNPTDHVIHQQFNIQ